MSCPTARRHPSAAPSSASLGALVSWMGGSTQPTSALGESTLNGCVGHSLRSSAAPNGTRSADPIPGCPNEDLQNESHHLEIQSYIRVYLVFDSSTRVPNTLRHTILGASSARRVLDPHPAGLQV
ncbi:hypothetical protein PF005_g28340 [Phytophthora fragariae]|uniref:Uncharacterized protein n=1 Tax=Phytophthora fragariae TaxID=53985 RepID=A0A6A3VNV7_9STRA|nr:hypothetical protein PF007_g25585 [Phytophthora fragariae]KAE9168522.1 hypothetical protein PF005_g28340 [Phytophthora fragariae]